MTPLHHSDSHSTHQKIVKVPSTTWDCRYDSALQGSNHCQALPSYQLCLEIQAHPASSHQSTLPIWLAANAEQDLQCGIRTPTTLERNDVHWVDIRMAQDSQQTRFGWAWEDWCPGTHNQLNFLSWPAKHYMLYAYTCTYMYLTGMYMHVHECKYYEHVHTTYSCVWTWIRQNITYILECCCRRFNMASIYG